MLVKPRRLLFQSSGYLLSLVVGFGLPYWLVRLITGSKMLATYVLAFSIVLVTPLLFIVLYWSYRLEFRPLPITPEESKNNSQSSMLLAISSLFLIWGVLISTRLGISRRSWCDDIRVSYRPACSCHLAITTREI
jgi:hypothetical protein